MNKACCALSLTFFATVCVPCGAADETKPLLATQWGQRGLYAQYAPKQDRLGCWSVALAQILYYHKAQPTGQVSYEGKGYRVSETLSRRFNWGLFANSLTPSTPAAKRSEVARYCYYTAIAIGKDFAGEEAYKGDSDARRKGITEHFGCSTRAFRTYREGAEAVRKAILSELAEQRPLLLYVEGQKGLGHAFAIDGVRTIGNRFEVHLNCGWNGDDDGWYDFEKPLKTSRGVFDKPNRWVLAIRPNAQDGAR